MKIYTTSEINSQSTPVNFDDFANFSNDLTEKEKLELYDDPRYEDANSSSGSFITGFDTGNNHYVKFMRFLVLDEDGRARLRGVEEHDAPLVEIKSDATREERKKAEEIVVEKLLVLAKKKQREYDVIRDYLGDEMLTRLYGYAIVRAPRKLIQERYKSIPEDILKKIPEAELTIMEDWDKIDSKRAFVRLSLDDISSAYNEDTTKKNLASFSDKVANLFLKEGIMPDICDDGGIEGRDPQNKKVRIKEPTDVAKLLQGLSTTLVYPRNVALSQEGEPILFDSYTIDYVPHEFLNDLKAFAHDLALNNLEIVIKKYSEWFKNNPEMASFARGLILLKTLGAKFDMS